MKIYLNKIHEVDCEEFVVNIVTWKIAAGTSLFVSALLFGFPPPGEKEDAHVLDEEEGLSLLRVVAATENLVDKYITGRGAHGQSHFRVRCEKAHLCRANQKYEERD
ncbi:unnamed protein product [Arabis nemorensis]|uniref:Uncharacterized protein n=1 Tax=Arabis nemorensis TaxID=586526 RepID=A0A565BSD6_9BRAS|nr:unnamed protein product [Arabis nemorensis]